MKPTTSSPPDSQQPINLNLNYYLGAAMSPPAVGLLCRFLDVLHAQPGPHAAAWCVSADRVSEGMELGAKTAGMLHRFGSLLRQLPAGELPPAVAQALRAHDSPAMAATAVCHQVLDADPYALVRISYRDGWYSCTGSPAWHIVQETVRSLVENHTGAASDPEAGDETTALLARFLDTIEAEARTENKSFLPADVDNAVQAAVDEAMSLGRTRLAKAMADAGVITPELAADSAFQCRLERAKKRLPARLSPLKARAPSVRKADIGQAMDGNRAPSVGRLDQVSPKGSTSNKQPPVRGQECLHCGRPAVGTEFCPTCDEHLDAHAREQLLDGDDSWAVWRWPEVAERMAELEDLCGDAQEPHDRRTSKNPRKPR